MTDSRQTSRPTRDEIFAAWAPAGGRYCPWVKPVLFSCMTRPLDAAPVPALPPDVDLQWVPAASENTALVLDLPGAEGVAAAPVLARLGYFPVALYNAIPWDSGDEAETDEQDREAAVVDVAPILVALRAAAPALLATPPPAEGPPAFLLDANRRIAAKPVRPGRFDNRSVSFATDFPSATFLLRHGIHRAVLVQRSGEQPQADLAHTLRAWQEGGIAIALKRVELAGAPTPCTVARPSRFGLWCYRALEMLGLRRHVLGGFGGLLQEPSSAG